MTKKPSDIKKKPAEKKKTARATASKRTSKPSSESGHHASATDLGQFGGIVSKSLELAGASINLGINLVQKFGSSFDGQLLGKIADAGKNIFSAKEIFAQASPSAPSAQSPAPDAAQQPHFGGIVNRLPLFPGSTVNVPFSINNDAPDTTRKVKLHLEEFKGELTGATLGSEVFSITPASKHIAPLDFEKFVITGTVPINCKSDAYDGTIVVSGDESIKIPLKITIMSRG
jgi:hypothetical protein